MSDERSKRDADAWLEHLVETARSWSPDAEQLTRTVLDRLNAEGLIGSSSDASRIAGDSQ